MQTNLLHGDWSLVEIAEILKNTPRRPLLPVLGSTEWQRVARNPQLSNFITRLQQRAENEWDLPLPTLTDELYAITARTGSRAEFESVYFERRRMLARAAIAFLLRESGNPNHARLERTLVTKVTDILDEPSWSLPAHVTHPSGKDPLRIDLFCAETANLMAEMIDLFGTILPPDLQRKIQERLQHDIFDNYLNRYREMEWPTAGMNWNAVCHQGVVGAALSQVDDPDLLAEMLLLARGFLPIFLRGFTPDGGSSEGPGYWDYGFGRFVALNEQLETRTNGRLSLIEGDNHVRAIARFGPLTQLTKQKFMNFSDGPAEGILNPSLLGYLGERLGEPLLHNLSADNYRYLTETGIDLDAFRSDAFHLTRLLLYWPEQQELISAEEKPEDIFFPDMGVLVAHGRDHRGHHWDFAAKGGHNHEHHNHNDCGSYLVNVNGERLIAEIGAPEYVADYFGPRRYDFLAARTLGHSLPIINGAEQATGESFRSRILRHTLGKDRVELEIDLTGCYPPEADCEGYIRTFCFDKNEGRILVTDAFILHEMKSLENSVITTHPVLSKPDHMVIQGPIPLALRPREGTILNRVEKLTYKAHRTGAAAFVHRIVWSPALLTKQVRLEYDIEIL